MPQERPWGGGMRGGVSRLEGERADDVEGDVAEEDLTSKCDP